MAERRMFAKTIIRSDAFLDMPHSTQNLYFHLNSEADDEGFVNNPKTVMRVVKCNEDDMRLLIGKKFIIPFESGVIVIKHWKIHNYIRGDRIRETKYQEEKSLLEHDENQAYRLADICQPTDNQLSDNCHTEVRLGKDSIGKINKDNSRFAPPSLEEIQVYCKERNNNVDAEAFFNHYVANGWYRGKTKIKDWKACVRTWEKNDKKPQVKQGSFNRFPQREYSEESMTELERKMLERTQGK